ncbi:MAG: ABC transporter ATP-binding protein [Lachnospiraceae bacterium]|nr:ABC transporter ATP-binding protein [Lachnospiraceae bacterium]
MKKTSVGIKITDLTKTYPSYRRGEKDFTAVDHISVDINPGEFVTLLGPSGCGKTTTLRMVAGFEDITSGEIYLGDTLLNDVPPEKRNTAMVFQSYALFPNYNVFDNIAYGLKVKKLPKDQIARRVRDIIKLVGLEGMETRLINQISGGQQQRVALARALVVEPEVLLFDEPLSNLDAALRIYMRTEIRKIQKKLGITAMYVTHDQAEAMSLSDRIIILRNGVIEQVGTPEDVYYRPVNQFVAGFIGTANFLEGEIRAVDGEKMNIEVHGVELKNLDGVSGKSTGDKCTLMIRPEAVTIGREGDFPCKVILSTFMGSYQYYEVMLGDTLLQIHYNNPKGKESFKEGDDVFVSLDSDVLYVL